MCNLSFGGPLPLAWSLSMSSRHAAADAVSGPWVTGTHTAQEGKRQETGGKGTEGRKAGQGGRTGSQSAGRCLGPCELATGVGLSAQCSLPSLSCKAQGELQTADQKTVLSVETHTHTRVLEGSESNCVKLLEMFREIHKPTILFLSWMTIKKKPWFLLTIHDVSC